MAIEQLLQNKNSSEKSRIKSQEISKYKHAGVFDSIEHGIKVEIVGDVTAINVNGLDGVQVFARAWKNGRQLGFSSDGSVEIERFRIFNPPILVDDPQGTIIRTFTDSHTKIEDIRTLREDPVEAVRQSLAHTILLIGKEGSKIISGKIGNTTDTFYPDAGNPGTTSCDGSIEYRDAAAYATAHDATNGTHLDFETERLKIENYYSGSLYYVNRNIVNFDTSSIPDTATIDSAVVSLYGTLTTQTTADDYSVVANTGAANASYSVADFDQFGTTKFATDITGASFSATGYNDWTLNATGIAAISKTGVSKLGFRSSKDISNTAPLGANYVLAYSADFTGTSSDPKLVVTYTAVTTSIKSINGLPYASIKSVNGLAIGSVKNYNGLA